MRADFVHFGDTASTTGDQYCVRKSSCQHSGYLQIPNCRRRCELWTVEALVVQGVGRTGRWSFRAWVVQGVGRSGRGSFRAWVVQGVGRSGRGSFRAWVVQGVGRSGRGSFRAWVQKSRSANVWYRVKLEPYQPLPGPSTRSDGIIAKRTVRPRRRSYSGASRLSVSKGFRR